MFATRSVVDRHIHHHCPEHRIGATPCTVSLSLVSSMSCPVLGNSMSSVKILVRLPCPACLQEASMACAAVLIPCHSGAAEILPQDIAVDEVLQVNQVASSAVGFMIHGDALITQTTGPAAKDLLSEVQNSLDQLSAFSTGYSSPAAVQKEAAETSIQPSPAVLGQPAQTVQSEAAATHTLIAPSRQRRQACRIPASQAFDARHAASPEPSSASNSAQAASLDEFSMFESPQLPGMENSAAVPASDVVGMHTPDQWGTMQPELLGNILQQVQWSSSEAIALTAVCRSWRSIVTADQQFLKQVNVRIDPRSPLHNTKMLCDCCRGMSFIVQQSRHRQLPLPRVIDKAASGGNISASVCVAQITESRGDASAALKYWSRAAKLGHPEAQFRIGRACYEGNGLAPDAEDALLWLGRAAKTLLAEDISIESLSNVSTARLVSRRAQRRHSRQIGLPYNHNPSFQTEASMPEEEVLAKAALLLGFLHLDGEATKFDAAEALKWFKVALLNDCAEAERIIGTLFNTGQYG